MHNSLSGELGGGVGTSRLMTIGAELKGGLREAVGMEGEGNMKIHQLWDEFHVQRLCIDSHERVAGKQQFHVKPRFHS